MADARHYPSISWIDSYTEYLPDIEDWWNDLDSRWLSVRSEAMNILLEDNRLQQVVKLVGSDALPPAQQFVLFVAEMIKNAFLQQNAFDPMDKYCSPEKQVKLLAAILDLYHRGADLLKAGVTVKQIAALDVVSEMVRLKSEVPNRELDQIDAYSRRLAEGLDALRTQEMPGESA